MFDLKIATSVSCGAEYAKSSYSTQSFFFFFFYEASILGQALAWAWGL